MEVAEDYKHVVFAFPVQLVKVALLPQVTLVIVTILRFPPLTQILPNANTDNAIPARQNHQ
jgi:hypothetical protein